MGLKSIAGKTAAHYDKVILAVVIVALVGSLLFLALRVGAIKNMQERFMREMQSWRPQHAEAIPEDVTDYEQAQLSIGGPFQLTTWSNAMFVPEKRAWCVECQLPIPFESEACPFCKSVVPTPPPPNPDIDGDGLDNEWEKKHGLNPYDPGDADKDHDGDKFTTREEYMAEPKTDPTDPESRPPIVVKLRVKALIPDRFLLRFKSKMKQIDGSHKFALNLRGGAQTFFVSLGESVAGFKVVDFEEKHVEYMQGPTKRIRDESVLILERADRRIKLVIGQNVQHSEFTAHLLFLVDDSEFQLKLQDQFDLDGERYQLIEIDTDREGVVIERLHDKAKFKIWKDRESTE